MPGPCSRSRPSIRAAGGRLRASTPSAADPPGGAESEPDLTGSTGRTRASQVWLLAVAACLATACGSTATGARAAGLAGEAAASPAAVRPSPGPATATPGATERPPAPAKPLAGITVGIDPGHNGLNGTDPAYINHLIWNGRASETCDTTGTQTAGGYTEALFNFNVARYLRAALVADGARVVVTRKSNHGLRPCVDRRAQVLNNSGARVAVDIHADGGPAWGRGFTVLEPVADGPNDHVIRSSGRLARDIRAALLARTSMPGSNYFGRKRPPFPDDPGRPNLTTRPKGPTPSAHR